MANDQKTVYLPKMPVRPGQTHSYQSTKDTKVVAMDPEQKRTETKRRASRVVSTGGDDE